MRSGTSASTAKPRRGLAAAESAFERWRNSTLEPYPSRVVQRTLPDGPWRDAPMPPFGTRSEVKFCGALAGAPVVRVDTTRPWPLLRVLVGERVFGLGIYCPIGRRAEQRARPAAMSS